MQVAIPHVDVLPTILKEWNTSWVGMLDTKKLHLNIKTTRSTLCWQ
jgi:hypothetical protein